MSRRSTLEACDGKSTSPTASAERRQREDVDLHQALPPIFARMLACFLRDGEEPLATLFVPSEEARGQRSPARALVLIADGALFMEESEAVLPDSRRGVKSLFYSYAQITPVEMGAGLPTGRFILHGVGNAPVYEITLPAENRERFQAVARLIGEKVAVSGSRRGEP